MSEKEMRMSALKRNNLTGSSRKGRFMLPKINRTPTVIDDQQFIGSKPAKRNFKSIEHPAQGVVFNLKQLSNPEKVHRRTLKRSGG